MTDNLNLTDNRTEMALLGTVLANSHLIFNVAPKISPFMFEQSSLPTATSHSATPMLPRDTPTMSSGAAVFSNFSFSSTQFFQTFLCSRRQKSKSYLKG